MLTEAATRKLDLLPRAPGVYLFHDAAGEVVYVGKASNLRNRVKSYFGSKSGLSTKVVRLVEVVTDLEFTLTGTEQQALVLEADLVKRYRPQYNARLKDDKSFPYLKIDVGSTWPTVTVTRRRLNDDSLYFGPFASARSMRQTLRLIRKVFRFRVCSGALDTHRARPCLNKDIGLCPGPCVGAVSESEYRTTIDRIVLFLKGRRREVLESLVAEMKAAAASLDFERAALLRDRVEAVDLVTRRHEGVTALRGDQDILAVAQNAGHALVEVFSVRDGRGLGREDFPVEGAGDLPLPEVLRSFVLQYYGAVSSVPPLVLLQHPIADAGLIRGWLSELRGAPVRIVVPRQGVRLRLVQTVADNVARELVSKGAGSGESAPRDEGLRQLKDVLSLPAMPQRIEGFDISTIQGAQAVGSMVVFEWGVPKPSDYRRFKIRTVSGQDDYSMMREVLERRFARMEGTSPGTARPGRSWGSSPDLVLVDGGRGQLGVAVAVRNASGAADVRVASLAKEHELVFSEEWAAPVDLPEGSPGLLLLQAVRDEAHRFAVAYHRNLRDSSAAASLLDSIPGIGPRRKRSLLVAFGSVEAMRTAGVEELALRGGLSRALAEQVRDALSDRGR